MGGVLFFVASFCVGEVDLAGVGVYLVELEVNLATNLGYLAKTPDILAKRPNNLPNTLISTNNYAKNKYELFMTNVKLTNRMGRL